MILLTKDISLLEYFNIVESTNPFTHYLIYKINNEVAGYLSFDILYEKIEITNIFVLEDYRNKGIASSLIEHLINYCKEENKENITLEVSKENEPAIKLYKKYNFLEKAKRKGYYKGVDGILMELIL